MKKFLILCVLSLFLEVPAFANWVLICPTDASHIEDQINSHWMHSVNWYSSWAQVQMGNVTGTGGVRGPMDGSLPHTQNRKPHLQFSSLIISDDADRGEVEIDCQYQIVHNPEVFDRNFPSLASVDNIFWMKGFLIGSKNQCRQIDRVTVSCY